MVDRIEAVNPRVAAMYCDIRNRTTPPHGSPVQGNLRMKKIVTICKHKSEQDTGDASAGARAPGVGLPRESEDGVEIVGEQWARMDSRGVDSAR